MKKILFVLISFATLSSLAQTPNIGWQKCLGGSQPEECYDMKETNDGGHILAGYTWSNDGDVTNNHGGQDAWIVKLQPDGSIDWQKCLGGSGNDAAYSIQQTSDNGYIVAGYSSSNDGDVSGNHGNKDYWIIKLTNKGNIVWEKNFGGTGDDIARVVKQTSAGGYIIAGSSNSVDGDLNRHYGSTDYWIVQINDIGEIEWQESYGGSFDDVPYSIEETTDGGYIIAGSTASWDGNVIGHHGTPGRYNFDIWVIKLNVNRGIEWQKCFGGSYDEGGSAQQTSDGGYIVAGSTSSFDEDVNTNHSRVGTSDYWILKLTANGDIQWQKCFGGSEDDGAHVVRQTSKNGYLVGGFASSNDGDLTEHHGGTYSLDCWMVQLDSLGEMKWQKSIGGSKIDDVTGIEQTSDGGYFVAGTTHSFDGDISGSHGDLEFWVVSLTANSLPLTLIDFSASTVSNIVQLKWKTLNEVNTAYFDVQRSWDGINFNSIGKVNASGISSAAANYNFVDNSNLFKSGNRIYYRLNEVDKDGNSSFSTVVSINLLQRKLFALSPNPTRSTLIINGKGLVQIQVFDLAGRLVLIQKDLPQNIVVLDVSKFKKGIYKVVVVNSENNSETESLLIQ